MNGKELIDAIVLLDSQSLRFSYVALTKTSMVKMVSSKLQQTSDKILKKPEIDRYDLFLKDEARGLTLSDEEIRLEILLETAKRLNISINYLDTNKGLVDLGDKILDTTVKEFKKIDNKFAGTTFTDLIQYQLQKMFSEIDKQYNKSSTDAKEAFAQNVSEFLNQLPQEQQDKLREELGIEVFSQKVISKVLAAGGSSILFSAIVNTMGFSFYMGASSLLASSAGLFGLTLPFAAYTTMSSVIAVVAAPLFVIGMLTFSGYYFTKQKSKLNTMMIPLTLMQVLLSYLSLDIASGPSYDLLINQWNKDSQNYKNLKVEQDNLFKKLNERENARRTQKSYKEHYIKEIQLHKNQIQQTKDKIKLYIKNNALDVVQPTPIFTTIYNEILTVKKEIYELSRKEVGQSGVFSVVKASVMNAGNSILRQEKEWKLNKAAEKMVEVIFTNNVNVCSTERLIIQSTSEKKQVLEEKLNTTNQTIIGLTKEIEDLQKQLTYNKQKRKKYEDKYYGIEHLAL